MSSVVGLISRVLVPIRHYMVCGLVNSGFSGNKDSGNWLGLGVFGGFSDSSDSKCVFASNDMWEGNFWIVRKRKKV